MRTTLRLAQHTGALIAATLLLVGCSTSSGTPDGGEQASGSDDSAVENELDVSAAWLDNGRMVALVTWGSSSCVPIADEVTADGQKVTVTLTEGDESEACTADLAPRASLLALPAGVDPTQDVEFAVTLRNEVDDVDLSGNPALTGMPGDPTDYAPSAGWFDDGSFVLLTWGSSSCQPIVESAEADGSSGTVTFKTEDRVCTMDMAPRTTIIEFAGNLDDEAPFVLTLVGDNLDATLDVIAG